MCAVAARRTTRWPAVAIVIAQPSFPDCTVSRWSYRMPEQTRGFEGVRGVVEEGREAAAENKTARSGRYGRAVSSASVTLPAGRKREIIPELENHRARD